MLPGLRLLLTTDAVGGVWRYAADLSRGLSGRGWPVTVAVVGPPPGAAQRREMAEGVAVVVTGLPLDWLAEDADLDRYAALAALAEGMDLALLHAPALLGSGDWPVPVAVMAHSCLRTWFAAVRHGPPPPTYARRATAAAAGFRRAQAVAAPTRSFAATVRDTYGLAEVTPLHGGRAPFALPEVRRERAVLTAGRLWDDGKNVAVLDRAASGLSAPFRAAGSAVGPQGARVALESLRLLGSLDEAGMALAFAGHGVFASASVYEPFGLAVLEAAQAGLALVLSDIPSFRELWDGAAVFVPPHDPEAWRAALERMLAAPEPWAERARARSARYGVAAMVDATAAWLAGVAA